MGAELEGSHEVKSNRGQLLSRSPPERLRRSLHSWFLHMLMHCQFQAVGEAEN
jgi:hypothetical protein